MPKRCYYDVLGLDKDVAQGDIKKVSARLAH
jgi:DnaJ-class molecular chaperone with C-terminal Zn finger domain